MKKTKKQSSASSQPEKLVRKTLDDILREAPEHEGELKRLAAMPDDQIDYSDIPELTDQQLARMVRTRLQGSFRPVKQAVYVRLDSDVIDWLKAQGPGYQTRMNEVLRKAMMSETARVKPRNQARG